MSESNDSTESGDARLTIPLLAESLHVEKRQVDRGGYRLTKRVETREELVDTPLQADQVTIERRPIGTVLASGEHPVVRQEGDVTIYPVLKEILVTEKRLLLVEEICITRSSVSYRDPQRVTLRSEEIAIERMDGGDSPSFKQP